MNPEIVPPELSFTAPAIAFGAVAAIVAVLLGFPLVDRFIRPRFRLERGSAMLVLLAIGLLAGIAGGIAGYFWLSGREAPQGEETAPHSPARLDSDPVDGVL